MDVSSGDDVTPIVVVSDVVVSHTGLVVSCVVVSLVVSPVVVSLVVSPVVVSLVVSPVVVSLVVSPVVVSPVVVSTGISYFDNFPSFSNIVPVNARPDSFLPGI